MSKLILFLSLTAVVVFLSRPCAAQNSQAVKWISNDVSESGLEPDLNRTDGNSVYRSAETWTEQPYATDEFQQQPEQYNYSTPTFKDTTPRLTFSVGALFLDRLEPDATPFLYAPALGSAPATGTVSSQSLDPGFDSGVLLSAKLYAENGNSIEFSYFGIDSWNIRQSLPYSNDYAFHLGGDIYNEVGPFDLQTTYTSSLKNFELNQRWRNGGWAALAGFRWLEIDEKLSSVAGYPIVNPVNLLDASTTNKLYGIQAGVEYKSNVTERFTVSGIAKAGVYYNLAEQSTSLLLINSNSLLESQGSKSLPAFVGEVGFDCHWQVTRHWAITAGYRMLLIDQAAVLSDQISEIPLTMTRQSGFQTGDLPTSGVTGGTSFYHGANVGAEFVW